MTLAVNIAQSGSNNVTFRNRIINGAMVIAQRGTSGFSETGAAQYTLDRWQVAGASPGVFSIAQSTTAPTGYINSLLITITTADASLSGASYQLQQKVEGLNITDLDWGLSTAKPVTLSFWVRSSLTGNFGGVLTNSNYDWTYPYSYTINSANTWEQKTVTVAGPTSGTWLTTNGTGIQLVFGLGAQVARTATAGVFANTVARQPTSSVNLIATNGATFYITGVQLEAGTTASPFEYRQYGTELALCQRYFQKVTNAYLGLTFNGASLNYGGYPLKVTMRAAPTLDSGASYSVASGSAGTPAFQNAGAWNSTTADVIQLYNSASNWTGSTHCAVSAGFSSEL
jgi:hypothetical protein